MQTGQRHIESYLAGLFDGEGCITTSREAYLSLELGMYAKESVLLLQEQLGGSVHQRTVNGAPYYRWRIYGNSAADALSCLLPYLVAKRLEATHALEMVSYPAKSAQRTWHARRLHELKSLRYA